VIGKSTVIRKHKQTRMKESYDQQIRRAGQGLGQSVTRRKALKKFGVGLGAMTLAGLVVLPVCAQVSQLGSLVELSQPNPLAGCNDGFPQPGTMTLNDAAEPFVAINPCHPNNIVAAWIGGGFQNVMSAVSLDGGLTWQQVPLPLTVCASTQPYLDGGDPWLSFAPNGDLYAIAIVGLSFSSTYIAVVKSTDGGVHWSAPAILDTPGNSPDKTTIKADPSDSHFAYAMWDRDFAKNRNAIAFSRTTDGGTTWEPARSIVETSPQSFAYGVQFGVLPDGTLLIFYQFVVQQLNHSPAQTTIQVLRSADKGQTWSAPTNALVTTPLLQPNSSGWAQVFDPETGQLVRDPSLASFAVGPHSGAVYAVWDDARFSNFQYNQTAFTMSMDGGLTWSTPICVNQTPLNLSPLNRQAFLPTIAVAGNGTIGVAYYDFRFNDPGPGLPTDYWLVQCNPSPATSPTNPASWGNELRLTSGSFNMEVCAKFLCFFPGDYFGLTAAGGGGFISAFGAVDQNGHTSIFARRVGE
jgi:hypothetical protein